MIEKLISLSHIKTIIFLLRVSNDNVILFIITHNKIRLESGLVANIQRLQYINKQHINNKFSIEINMDL